MSAPERVPRPPSVASQIGAIELSDVDDLLAMINLMAVLRLPQYFVIHYALLCTPIIIWGGFLHLDVIWEETRLSF